MSKEQKKDFRCIVCDKNDWENIDKYRIKEVGMSICKSCGFISYPSLYKTEEEILDYYRNDYRGAPNISTYFTGVRKLHYHNHFLNKYFKKWAEEKKDKPFICDVGAAFGMFLNWTRQFAPNANLYGVELTKGFRRNAYHLYNLNLTEKFDDSLKYDLISSYKCAEHIIDVDKEIIKYRNALNDDGILYISVPLWFKDLNNFGMGGFDLETYYHTNHINTWMQPHFEHILKKAKLKIIEEDHLIYPSTYICQKDDSTKEEEPPALYKEVMEKLEKVYDTYVTYEKSEYDKALKIYSNFPLCHVGRYEFNKKKYDSNGYDWIKKNIIERAAEDCKEIFEIMIFCADICMRYNDIELALDYLDKALKARPQSADAILKITHCFRIAAKKEPKEREQYIRKAASLALEVARNSPQHFNESMNWVYSDFAEIKTPFEKG